jgi:membrane protease YdiL (CAAX protease family)
VAIEHELSRRFSPDDASISNEYQNWRFWQAIVLGLVGLAIELGLYLWVSPLAVEHVRSELSTYQSFTLATLIALLGTTVLLIPLVHFFMRMNKDVNWWISIGWNGKRGILSSILVGAGCAVAVHGFSILLGGNPDHLAKTSLAKTFVLYVPTVVLLQPFIEESYFRGIAFLSLANNVGSLLSIVIVTALFLLVHLNHAALIAPVAVLLAYVRLRRNSLACCFALHASYNFLLFWLALFIR